MSDTPRTDCAILCYEGDNENDAWVRLEAFMRDLERENAALREALGNIIKHPESTDAVIVLAGDALGPVESSACGDSDRRCPHGIRWPHPCRECEDAPLREGGA